MGTQMIQPPQIRWRPEHGQKVERTPYDLLSGKGKAPRRHP